MSATIETLSLQPSLGSEFEALTLEQAIEETMVQMYQRGESPEAIAREIARVTAAFGEREEPAIERAAQCPKCRERKGYRTTRSTWLDMGKARERICRACGYFFRTFEPFPKYEENRR